MYVCALHPHIIHYLDFDDDGGGGGGGRVDDDMHLIMGSAFYCTDRTLPYLRYYSFLLSPENVRGERKLHR